MYICLHVSTHHSCKNIKKTWIFWRDFRKNFTYQLSRKSIQWDPCCSMRKDGRTDSRQTYRHDEANGYFSQFCDIA